MRGEAWPDAATPDELHDALLWLTFLTRGGSRSANPAWPAAHATSSRRRAASRGIADGAGRPLWVATERRALFEPRVPSSDEALVEIVRGRLEGLGPVDARRPSRTRSACRPRRYQARSRRCKARASRCAAVSPRTPIEEEWCERRLLARIHRYTVKRLRAEIEPVQARDFLRFLFEWQRVLPDAAHAGIGCRRGRARAARGLRGPRRRLGDRDPARAHHRVRAANGWTSTAARAASCGRGSSRARFDRERRRLAGALDAHHAAGAAQRQSLVGVHRRARCGAPDLACPRGGGFHRRRTVRRSSMRSPSTSACCRSRSRRRSRSWSRSAW